MRSTRIRSDQKTWVSVPNKQMVDSVLDNLSLRTQRRGDLRLELALQTNSEKLGTFVSSIKKILDRKDIEEANVFLDEIKNNAFVILSDYYTAPVTYKEFINVKEEINLQVLKLMEQLQIELAGANVEVRLSK